MKLDELTPELLYIIVSYSQTSRADPLLALKLCNRTLSTIAHKTAARTISIGISHDASLEHDAEVLRARLDRTGCLDSVTELIIRGYKGRSCSRYSTLVRDPMTDNKGDIIGFDTQAYPSGRFIDVKCPASTMDSSHEGWLALANLITSLPGLSRVTSACIHQLPPVVMDAIELRRTLCKLNIRALCLHGFQWTSDGVVSNTERELRVIESSCLHAARILHSTYWYMREIYEQGERVAQIFNIPAFVISAAPNLQNVVIHNMLDDSQTRDQASIAVPASEAWPMVITSRSTRLLREVQSLDIGGIYIDSSVTIEGELDALSEVINWDHLRHLRLLNPFSRKALIALSELALPSLRTLQWLMFEINAADFDYEATVTTWLNRLPYLEELSLHGTVPKDIVDTVLRHRGKNLTLLGLRGEGGYPTTGTYKPITLSYREVNDLVSGCPHLKHLDMTLLRTQGNAEESAIYRALGQLHELESVTLRMLIVPYALVDGEIRLVDTRTTNESPSIGSELVNRSQQLSSPEIKNALINAAIDNELLSAIGECISEQRPKHCAPFRHMQVVAGGLNALEHLEPVHAMLQEILSARVYVRSEGARRVDRDKAARSAWLMEIFRELWPYDETATNWWTAWRSHPLQVLDGSVTYSVPTLSV